MKIIIPDTFWQTATYNPTFDSGYVKEWSRTWEVDGKTHTAVWEPLNKEPLFDVHVITRLTPGSYGQEELREIATKLTREKAVQLSALLLLSPDYFGCKLIPVPDKGQWVEEV